MKLKQQRQDLNILVLQYNYEPLLHLFNIACDPQYKAGYQNDSFFLVPADSKFNPDGTEQVEEFNQLMHHAKTRGFTFIQIPKNK